MFKKRELNAGGGVAERTMQFDRLSVRKSITKQHQLIALNACASCTIVLINCEFEERFVGRVCTEFETFKFAPSTYRRTDKTTISGTGDQLSSTIFVHE
jgi:hypothetical protein